MSPADYWRFIEAYLPNYYSRDDVLLSDILYRYITSDEESCEDVQMIKKAYPNRHFQ